MHADVAVAVAVAAAIDVTAAAADTTAGADDAAAAAAAAGRSDPAFGTWTWAVSPPTWGCARCHMPRLESSLRLMGMISGKNHVCRVFLASHFFFVRK